MSVRLKLNPPAAGQIVPAAALQAAGEVLLSASRAQVPVDSGELRDSGQVRTNQLQSVIAYTAPHAAIVHEKRTAHSGGKAKFLEDAANDPAVQAAMLAALRRNIRI